MKATYIDYSETHSFSDGLIRLLENDPKLAQFYDEKPDIEGFKSLIERKENKSDRALLAKVLREQYSKIKSPLSPTLAANIKLLEQENTFTVCTGHQLNLFTGPLYFIFKIVTAINLAKELKKNFPDKNFVPLYWMATEDHDFEEINHTYIAGKKISWAKNSSGASGRIQTVGIDNTVKEYLQILGLSENAEFLNKLIKTTYCEHSNLADATRYLANALFEDYGLVVLDADDIQLKKQFASIIERDIIEQNSFKHISETNLQLAKEGIEAQVNPREINFFYLLDDLRERIVFENNSYGVLNTEIRFTEDQLKKEIAEHPDRFSPNVVMRPLYQELILPNLAYIGGGAEIIYWMQLKQTFNHYGVEFPILLLRNSAMFSPINLASKLNRLNINTKDIFKDLDLLKKEWVLNHSTHTLNLKDEWQELSSIFEKIKLRSHKIDPSLGPSTEAVKVRLQRAIQNLEKKLMKAEKKNFSDALSQIEMIKTKLFPNGGLQERSENFGLFYVKHGQNFIKALIDNFKPLDLKFTILED